MAFGHKLRYMARSARHCIEHVEIKVKVSPVTPGAAKTEQTSTRRTKPRCSAKAPCTVCVLKRSRSLLSKNALVHTACSAKAPRYLRPCSHTLRCTQHVHPSMRTCPRPCRCRPGCRRRRAWAAAQPAASLPSHPLLPTAPWRCAPPPPRARAPACPQHLLPTTAAGEFYEVGWGRQGRRERSLHGPKALGWQGAGGGALPGSGGVW